MENKKRYLLTFRAEKYRRRRIYVTCAEADLPGEKEVWAMRLEEETGIPWRCESVEEVDAKSLYIGSRGGGAN